MPEFLTPDMAEPPTPRADSQTFRNESVPANRWTTGLFNIADFAIDKWKASRQATDPFDPAVGASGINSTIRTEGKPEETQAHNTTLLVIGGVFLLFLTLVFLRR